MNLICRCLSSCPVLKPSSPAWKSDTLHAQARHKNKHWLYLVRCEIIQGSRRTDNAELISEHFLNPEKQFWWLQKVGAVSALPTVTLLTSAGLLRFISGQVYQTPSSQHKKNETCQKDWHDERDKSMCCRSRKMTIAPCIILRQKLRSPCSWVWTLMFNMLSGGVSERLIYRNKGLWWVIGNDNG